MMLASSWEFPGDTNNMVDSSVCLDEIIHRPLVLARVGKQVSPRVALQLGIQWREARGGEQANSRRTDGQKREDSVINGEEAKPQYMIK